MVPSSTLARSTSGRSAPSLPRWSLGAWQTAAGTPPHARRLREHIAIRAANPRLAFAQPTAGRFSLVIRRLTSCTASSGCWAHPPRTRGRASRPCRTTSPPSRPGGAPRSNSPCRGSSRTAWISSAYVKAAAPPERLAASTMHGMDAHSTNSLLPFPRCLSRLFLCPHRLGPRRI